jgi:hypothetical protein
VGVRKALRELDEGKGISHDKIKEEFAEWLPNDERPQPPVDLTSIKAPDRKNAARCASVGTRTPYPGVTTLSFLRRQESRHHGYGDRA